MTGEQRRLYTGMLRLFNAYPSGSVWSGVRGSTSGLSSPTFTSLGSVVIRFLENNRIVERSSLPAIPIYTAAWWGLASADVDIQAGDVYTNGARAFTITGMPDTSQGFQVIPAATLSLIAVPGMAVRVSAAGYQIGLRIGAF